MAISQYSSLQLFFPKKILDDESLLSKVQATLLAMQKSWKFCLITKSFDAFDSSEKLYNLALFPNLISTQDAIHIIKDFSSKVYFEHVQIKWLKTCQYHLEKKNTKLLSKKEAEQLEEKLLSQHQNDPTIIADSVSPKKNKRRRNNYDVRIKFKHINNVKECDYPSIPTVEKIKVSALEILELIESQFIESEESVNDFYQKVAQIVFEDHLFNKEQAVCL